MKHIFSRKIVALFVCLLSVLGLSAQGLKDVRINEVLVKNTDSFEDNYGNKIGWIELHNAGYSNVNLSGAYLAVRKGGQTITYKIPKNDVNTVIPPQGYAVFFADGTSTKGTFHTNFKLEEADFIALYDQSGRAPAIDSLSYNLADVKENVSMGWMLDENQDLVFMKELPSTTPLSTNNVIEFESRGELFRKHDPIGIGMAVTAMSVVFAALILLYLIFKRIGLSMVALAKRKENKGEESKSVSKVAAAEEELSGEAIAAIALALKKYEENLHDVESAVITINRVAKVYSPWSSKIYGLTQTPERKNK